MSSSHQLDQGHPYDIRSLLFPPECTDMIQTGRPIASSLAHCSPSSRPHSLPSATPLNPTIQFGQQVYNLAAHKTPSLLDPIPRSANLGFVSLQSHNNMVVNGRHTAAPATDLGPYGQADQQDTNYSSTTCNPDAYPYPLCQQLSKLPLAAHHSVQHQQPNVFLQAPFNGSSPSVNASSAEHTPNGAQSHDAKSNGRPVTSSSGVFARLGVPTTRPTPQGPDGRGRPQPYPSSSPSTALAGNVDQHPPGFASPMKLPSTASPVFQSATDSDVSRSTTTGYNKSMHADRGQPSQPQTDSLQRPVQSQVNSQQSRSGDASGRGEDLPPGFTYPSGQTDQRGGALSNGNEVDRSAMAGQLNGNDKAPGSSNGASEQAHMNWAEVNQFPNATCYCGMWC